MSNRTHLQRKCVKCGTVDAAFEYKGELGAAALACYKSWGSMKFMFRIRVPGAEHSDRIEVRSGQLFFRIERASN